MSERPDPYDTRQGLIAGLVGTHRDLYRNSPTFHAGIEMMANMVPLWVKGMAEEAKASDHTYAQSRAQIKIDALVPIICVCGHPRYPAHIARTPGNVECVHCVACTNFTPRWHHTRCEAWVPQHVLSKTGFAGEDLRCLREEHPVDDVNHVQVDGNQWVAWT